MVAGHPVGMRRTLFGIAGTAIGLVMLTACGSTANSGAPATTTPGSPGGSQPPATAGSGGTTTEKPAGNDNSCGPVEVCGTATVSGGQTLSTQFFSVLSELNNRKCADWAKGTDDSKLPLPRVSNSERTLVFFADDPITYNGPATYTDPDLLKDATLQVNGKNYTKGKGQAEVKMAADGDGSITLTSWTVDGEGTAPVTLKVTWTCTDR
jgi:hypothetical protein